MALSLRVLSETPTSVTLAWDPQACAGFLFYVDGVRKSSTLDGPCAYCWCAVALLTAWFALISLIERIVL